VTCPGDSEEFSSASRGPIGLTELALLTAHERECADCRKERPSTPAGGLAGRHSRRPTFVTSARRASARAIAAARLAAGGLGDVLVGIVALSTPIALATTRLAGRLVRASAPAAIEGVRIGATRSGTVMSRQRRLLPPTLDRGRRFAAGAIVSTRSAVGRFVDGRLRAYETWASAVRRAARVGKTWTRGLLKLADTRFLLRVCPGIATLGLLAMGVIFVSPRRSPDRMATPPPAVTEASDVVAAPPPLLHPPAPSAEQTVTRTTGRPSPAPRPEPSMSARNPAREIVREGAVPEAPDPSAAIDWLLKGAGATGRRDRERQ
jgi:hypothetical protein